MKIGMINQGTWEVEDATAEQAQSNMACLLADSRVTDEMSAVYCPERNYGGGRYCFVVTHKPTGRNVEVQMPGCALDRVRWINAPNQNIMSFPRLYVDGMSWYWIYAADALRYAFEDADIDEG